MGEPWKPEAESMRAREERLTQEAWGRLSGYGITDEDVRTTKLGTSIRLRLMVAELFLEGESAKTIASRTGLTHVTVANIRDKFFSTKLGNMIETKRRSGLKKYQSEPDLL